MFRQWMGAKKDPPRCRKEREGLETKFSEKTSLFLQKDCQPIEKNKASAMPQHPRSSDEQKAPVDRNMGIADAHIIDANQGRYARSGVESVYKNCVQTPAHSHAFSCTPMRISSLKLLADRQLSIGFHAVGGGSNPPGDAKFGYYRER